MEKLSRSQTLKEFEMVDPRLSELKQQIMKDRPYRIPKGYCRWETIAANLAAGLLTIGVPGTDDLATRLHGNRGGVWLTNNAPVYIVSKDLLRLFEQTEISLKPGNSLLQGLEFPLHTALLLFPENALISPSRDSGCVDWAIVHLSDAAHPERSRVDYGGIKHPALRHEQDHPYNFHWSSIDTSGCTWFSGCNITADDSIVHSGTSLGGTPMDKDDHAFTDNLLAICLQCLLAIGFQPKLVSESGTVRGDAKPGNKQGRHWSPRVLRLPESAPNTQPRNEQHDSPRAHWRKGHLRNQPIGAGRSDRKLIWIQPMYINGN